MMKLMCEIVPKTKKIKLGYLPVLEVILPNGNKNSFTSLGDPLVTKQCALKYAQIWRNESLKVGYVVNC